MKPPKRPISTPLLIKGTVFYVLLALVVGFVLGTKYQTKNSSYPPAQNVSGANGADGGHVRRSYDPSWKIFGEIEYPAEMQVDGENLVLFSCNEETLTPYEMMRSGSDLTLSKVRNFALCKKKDGGGIFLITKVDGEMNSGETNMVYTIDEYDIYKPLTEIDLDGSVCGGVFQITKNNVAYLNCGWGDGGGATQQIIRLDLNNGWYEEILSCTVVNGEKAKCKF